jgi:WS/DGAT/MGAT family acyltransferase
MSEPTHEQLSFDDAQILALESDAIKGHTGKVLVVGPDESGRRLGAEALRARATERISALRRMRQRVEMPDRRGGPPAWVEAAELDLDWHISAAQVGEPLDDESFRALAGELLAERLDRERPLWRIDVVPLTGERTALVGRIHHAMADGVTAIAMVGRLLWDPAPKAAAAAPAATKGVTGGEPGESAAVPVRLRQIGGTLVRELRPGADTALDRHIGPEREVAWRRFGLGRLKAIGRGAGEGVTVNDVVLATVAGGLRAWFDAGAPGRVRVQVPVCLHHRHGGGDEGGSGNRDSFLNVDLPIGEPDALARLLAINTETSEAKLDHDAETLYHFFHAVGRFRPLYRGITRLTSGPREFALSVSNVPGPRERPSILGHDVVDFVSFAEPADRHALRVSVVSLGGELAFGLCSDPGAIGALDRLADALEDSVLELESRCGGA